MILNRQCSDALILYMLGNSSCFFFRFFFFKINFFKNSFRNTIRVSNCLDPDLDYKLFAKVISR